MTDLERLVRQYYGRQEMSGERVAAILGATPRGERRWYWGLAAALAAIGVGLGALHYHLQQRDIADLVLAEVAMNHNQGLEVEVASQDYSALQTRMDRLDFSLAPPEAVGAGFDLIGGRYCSIRGNIAAQLKLREKSTGEVLTLYVTDLTDNLARIAGREASRDGVRIRLWREGDRFFALAGPEGD